MSSTIRPIKDECGCRRRLDDDERARAALLAVVWLNDRLPPVPPSLLPNAAYPRNYDITPNGKQFLVVLLAAGSATDLRFGATQHQIHIVLNWFEDLKAKVPTK